MDWRIKSKKEIQALLQTKKKLHANTLNLFYLRRGAGSPRFVIIVSKKVSPLATRRNHARRQIRSMIREFLPAVSQPTDIAVIVKKEFLAADYAKNRLVFQRLLHKVLLGEN